MRAAAASDCGLAMEAERYENLSTVMGFHHMGYIFAADGERSESLRGSMIARGRKLIFGDVPVPERRAFQCVA